MKRYIALCLSLLMLVSLCSCGSEDTDFGSANLGDAAATPSTPSLAVTSSVLEGTWEIQVDARRFAQMQSNEKSFEGFVELAKELNITKEVVIVTFTSDGKMTYDVASMKACMNGMIDAVRDLLKDKDRYLNLMIKINNTTKAELEAKAAQQGTTLDQLLENYIALLNFSLDSLESRMDTDMLKDSASNYSVENNKLYTWKEDGSKDENKYMTLHYDGTKITVLEINGESVDANTVVYTRK